MAALLPKHEDGDNKPLETAEDVDAMLPARNYFSKVSSTYVFTTGNSTADLFANAYDTLLFSQLSCPPITSSSVIHDIAAGPGTAAGVIVEKLIAAAEGAAKSPEEARGLIPEMLVTDNVPGMVDGAKESLTQWPSIKADVLDATDSAAARAMCPDDKFTHVICNISIHVFPYANPVLTEIHRSLQPGGALIILTHSYFAMVPLVLHATRLIRSDSQPMPSPHTEYHQAGVVPDLVVKAGFDKEKMKVAENKVVVPKGTKNFEGLKAFMMGPFTERAKEGWTDEERGKWEGAVDDSLDKHCEEHGGILFKSWVIVARK